MYSSEITKPDEYGFIVSPIGNVIALSLVLGIGDRKSLRRNIALASGPVLDVRTKLDEEFTPWRKYVWILARIYGSCAEIREGVVTVGHEHIAQRKRGHHQKQGRI